MEEERHVFTCGITLEKIDIREVETVKVSGKSSDGILFIMYCKKDEFFKKFVEQEGVPRHLPGLRKYYSHKHPLVRHTYNPTKWGGAKANALFRKLFGDKPAETPNL